MLSPIASVVRTTVTQVAMQQAEFSRNRMVEPRRVQPFPDRTARAVGP